jgi:glycosyltransferase involved in cell wall biosynthesis
MGRPLIASGIGGQLASLPTEQLTGLLVPPTDEESLGLAVLRLLSDESIRRHMGEQARRRVELFQAGTVVPQIEQLYRRAVPA